jgi:hypothetical protein
MADILLEALLLIDAKLIQAAEKSHVLLRALNKPGPDGRIAVQMDDCKTNYDVLKHVLLKLNGRQPTSAMYCKAMHKLDQAARAICSNHMLCTPMLCFLARRPQE